MRVLRHRRTHRFVALLVGCGCGRKFLHRLDRPFIACLSCGTIGDMPRMLERLRDGASEARLAGPARRSRGRAA